MREIKLQDLKSQTPAELVSFAEEKGVENASTMRKQELMFAILKQLAIRRRTSLARASSRSSPTASDSCAPRMPTICRDRMTSMFRPRRSGVSDFAPAIRSRVTSAVRKKANAISRCSRSIL